MIPLSHICHYFNISLLLKWFFFGVEKEYEKLGKYQGREKKLENMWKMKAKVVFEAIVTVASKL